MKKCLVLDLDNTLWGGVVGEDGLDGIKLGFDSEGAGFLAFQQAILDLHNRGIILAINSKNTYEDAMQVIRKHPNMVLKEKCSCKGKGCSKCSAQLKLKAKGPVTVYSKELKGKVKVIYEEMPLVELTEEQELELVATARLGKGIEHTKFSPGLVYYRNVPEIEIDKTCQECKKCIEACPQDVFKIEKEKIEIKDIYRCDLCEACVEACKKNCKDKSCIQINPGKEIMFFIESFGMISAKEILVEAVKALEDNLKQVRELP